MRGAGARRERRVLARLPLRVALAGAVVLAIACAGAADEGEPAPADSAAADAAGPPTVEPAPSGEPADASPAPPTATRRFVNDRSRLTGARADHFVPFAFRYPADWRVAQDASTPGTPNFVKVERLSGGGTTIESLAIGWVGEPAAARGDPDGLRAALADLESRLARGFEGFEKTSESTVRVGGREGRGFRFVFRLPPESEVPRAFGRVILVPTGGDDGLALMMFATPIAQGVEGPEDVGETGGLAIALGSLEIGAAPVDPSTVRPRDLNGGSVPAIPQARPGGP